MEDDLRSACTHTKAWSPWQPALRVPGDPKVEEVRLTEEGAEVVLKSSEYRQRSGFTHTYRFLFSIFTGSEKCLCVWLCVFVSVCADE